MSDLRSFAFLPVSAGAAPLGVAVFAWSQPGRLVDDERAFLEAVVAQCGLALDRARRYESERVIAETLQRSVLPETLPSMEGVRVAALYLPGLDRGRRRRRLVRHAHARRRPPRASSSATSSARASQAAATMAQLRNGMRAITLDQLNARRDGDEAQPPARALHRRAVRHARRTSRSTPTRSPRRSRSAGHPPPLVVAPDGDDALPRGRAEGFPLGVDPDVAYTEHTSSSRPGTIVVLYTDGLVERRDRSIDDGLDPLARAAGRRRATRTSSSTRSSATLLGAERAADDVALLAIVLDPALARAARARRSRPTPSRCRTSAGSSSGWLDAAAVPDVDARDVVLATWEAGANAIEHAGRDRRRGRPGGRGAHRRPHPRRGRRSRPLEGTGAAATTAVSGCG